MSLLDTIKSWFSKPSAGDAHTHEHGDEEHTHEPAAPVEPLGTTTPQPPDEEERPLT